LGLFVERGEKGPSGGGKEGGKRKRDEGVSLPRKKNPTIWKAAVTEKGRHWEEEVPQGEGGGRVAAVLANKERGFPPKREGIQFVGGGREKSLRGE